MRNIRLVGLLSLVPLASSPAFSQESPRPPEVKSAEQQIEKITVTATKREETLQEVPLSVSVTSAATIEQAHIRDLIDLQSVVPSLKVSQFNAVGQTNFIIRGFGNGSGNDGIESSVGVFIDGVYRSRTSSAIDDLPEVSRIEVLRGTQSTLFGKNVSAGAISIITVKPQFNFGAKAEVGIGNYNHLQAKATVTGPISDTLAFRLSGNSNVRDGYLKNVTTGSDVNDRQRQSVRGDLLWIPSDVLSVRVIGDYNEIKEVCCGVVSLLNGPSTQFIGAPRPNGLGKPVGDPANKFDNNIIFNTDPTNRLTGKGISSQVDWQAALGTLTSITAYRKQTNKSIQDVDFTGADIANKIQPNDIKTFTQEFRLASAGTGPVSWLIGGFYQKEKLNSGTDTTYGTDTRGFIDGLTGRSTIPGLSARSTIFGFEYLQNLVTKSIIPGSTYFQAGQGIHDFYTMDQTAYSLFGNVDFKVTDRFTITAGLAYLSDRKNAASDVVLTDKFALLNLQNVPQLPPLGLPANAFGGLNAVQFFYANTPNHAPVNFPNATESGELKGNKLTHALRAAYDLGSVNAYVSYSTGWKAGAYNLSLDSRPPDVNGVGRTAGPENVTLYEAGLKASFRGGFVNLAVFNQAIKGFQSNAYTGTGYNLVNAGKESTRGFEVDAAYRPTAWLAWTGAATYLDPKYDSFTRAPCVSFDTVRCPVNPATGRRPDFRDLSGDRPAGIPKWSVSTSATASREVGNNSNVYLRVEYDYVSKTQLIETTPSDLSTWGQRSVNISMGFVNKPANYEMMLWARNLTNYRTIIATFPTVAQDGSFSGFPNQPRTYGATLRMKF